MRKRLNGVVAAALIATTMLPAAAQARDERQARAAISEARGKIEAGDRAGVSGDAADVQARARAALERADKAIRDDNEDAALHDAGEADALAGLAQATAELRKLEAERNQLAQR